MRPITVAATFILSALVLSVATSTPAAAQLLSDRVAGEQRSCIYVGSDQLADGQIVQRSTVVPASQPCPDIAPYRDPNQRIPGNAALLRETVENGQRRCVYGQGGVEYTRVIPPTRYCAATPDLLDRQPAGS